MMFLLFTAIFGVGMIILVVGGVLFFIKKVQTPSLVGVGAGAGMGAGVADFATNQNFASDDDLAQHMANDRMVNDQMQQMNDQMVQQMHEDAMRMSDPYQTPGVDVGVDESFHGIDHGMGIANPDHIDHTDHSMPDTSFDHHDFGGGFGGGGFDGF